MAMVDVSLCFLEIIYVRSMPYLYVAAAQERERSKERSNEKNSKSGDFI
jgi:hypothetical protein